MLPLSVSLGGLRHRGRLSLATYFFAFVKTILVSSVVTGFDRSWPIVQTVMSGLGCGDYLCLRRAVGWVIRATNDTNLALAALEHAVRARGIVPDLVHHTDRGSPYASDEYRKALGKCSRCPVLT